MFGFTRQNLIGNNYSNDSSFRLNNAINSKPDNAFNLINNVAEYALIPSEAVLYSPGLYDRQIPIASRPVSSIPDLFSMQIPEASASDISLIYFGANEDEAEGPADPDNDPESIDNLMSKNNSEGAAEEVEGAEVPEEEAENPLEEFVALTEEFEGCAEEVAGIEVPEEAAEYLLEEFEGLAEEIEGPAEEAEGPISLNNVPLTNNSSPNNNLSIIYKYAKLYKSTADAGMRFTKKTSGAIGHFVNAFSSTIAQAWNLGSKEFAKKIVKESDGIKHYGDAWDTLKKSWAAQIPSRLEINEKMGLVESLGEAGHYWCIRFTKGAITTTALPGTSLYTFGTATNALGYRHSHAANSPAYNISLQKMVTKAVYAPNLSSKLIHGATVVTGLAATVAVPYCMYI